MPDLDPSLDLTTRAWQALVNDWPIVIGLALLAWKGLPFALRSKGGAEALHVVMTGFINNGGGEKIKTIVREENALQTELHKNETTKIVQAAIEKHEEVEATRFRGALQEFEEEITDKYDLRPAPQRRRRDLKRRTR